MDYVRCKGNENHIQDCQFKGWGENHCNHGQDARVECLEGRYIFRRTILHGKVMV